jgi:cell division protein FtsI (penicillin-binding protein 3)
LAEGIMESHAEGGTVIAIYPSTGEILAMASYPTFDPNHNNNILPEAMRLQGITDIYEPGSTFKLITACAMIEEGILKPDSKVDGMGGTYRIGNYEIKDSHPMYKMSFSEALEQSSNIVFAKNSDNLSSDKFYKYARDFGFGIFLGIDLPGEVSGILKKPSAFDASTKRFMAYGYELGATALQVVNAYATVANRGIMMRPYVIKSIIDNDGGTILYNKPQRIRSVISNKTSVIVKDMLCGVVDRGTGQEAKIDGIRIAGKTGTAQQLIDGKYSKQAYTASFAGFFPADNPKIAMIVMLHRPKTDIYGGKTAAPIFRKIAQKWITASKLPINENLTDQELMQSKLIDSALVPDLRGISVEKAREMVHSIGLRLPRNAEGIIIEQYVPKGFWLKKGTDIPIKTGDASKKKTMILTDNSQKNIPGNQIRPNVKGMSVRRAMSVLHSAGYQVRVIGQGKVIGQVYNKAGKKECILSCE